MGRKMIFDDGGFFNVEVEVQGSALRQALEHEHADGVLTCAMLLALGVLVQDGGWPEALLATMGEFMRDMRTTLSPDALM